MKQPIKQPRYLRRLTRRRGSITVLPNQDEMKDAENKISTTRWQETATTTTTFEAAEQQPQQQAAAVMQPQVIHHHHHHHHHHHIRASSPPVQQIVVTQHRATPPPPPVVHVQVRGASPPAQLIPSPPTFQPQMTMYNQQAQQQQQQSFNVVHLQPLQLVNNGKPVMVQQLPSPRAAVTFVPPAYADVWAMTADRIPNFPSIPLKGDEPSSDLHALGMQNMGNPAGLFYLGMNACYHGRSIKEFREQLLKWNQPQLADEWMRVIATHRLASTFPYAIMARSRRQYAVTAEMITFLLDIVPRDHPLYKKSLLLKGDMCIHAQWNPQDSEHIHSAIGCFKEAIQLDANCDRALFCLGLCYSRNNDLETAFTFYKGAADLGHAGAMNNLGYYFEHHANDAPAAFKWYEASAGHGSPIGMCNAGILILQQIESVTGEERQARYMQALKYFEQSAAAGHVFAMTMVAEMHRNGYGVPVSYKKAFSYYHQAASHGDKAAMTAIGFLYYTGSPPNLRLAFEYFAKASDAGDASAYYNLAIMYEQGIPEVLPADVEHAQTLFEKSASMGYAPANAALGNVYWRSAMRRNNPELLDKARGAYREAIRQGFTRASVHLSLLTETILKEQTSMGQF